ncbi:MAG: CPBP family intramembrane glutamic endopeptidase [Thermoanaerobaculia bacterium]
MRDAADRPTSRPPSGRPPSGARSPGRGLWLLLAVYVAAMLGAAALTPPVYWAFQAWDAAGGGELASYLADKAPPRHFDRIRWLLVLAALPWLCRATGLASRRALGLTGGAEARRLASVWLAAGFVMVAGIAAGQLLSGTVALAPPARAGTLLGIVLLGLVSAALIAFFEELVFRGVVFQLADRALPAWGSVPVAAAIFALLHFQRVPSDAWPADGPVPWWSGFAVAWRSVTGTFRTAEGPVLFALFLAGTVLCLLFLRHRTLLAPMGLHAGWVWAAQIYRDTVRTAPGADPAVWGSRDLVDGAIPLALLVLLLLGMLLAFRYSAASLADRASGGGSGGSSPS